MASTQGQDVVLCHLCSNLVEHHCNLCHVDLCSPCTLYHLADKTNRHEIVEFINRKQGHFLPECNSHQKNRCELFCRNCNEPICVLCVTTIHKKHELTDIEEIIKKSKQQIIDDLAELENDIAPAYRNILAGVPSAEFDEVLSAIQVQEDAICKIVHDIGSHMREEVTKQKNQSEENRETELAAARTEKELNAVILNNRSILKSSNVTAIMGYESRNQIFRDNYNELGLLYPNFLPGQIRNEQIYEMFGRCQMNKTLKPISLLRCPGDTEPSNISSAFWNKLRKEGYQSTDVFGNPNSSQSFNIGASRNTAFKFGSAPQNVGFTFGGNPQNAGFTFGGTPQNAGSTYGIQHSGGLMGFGSKPRSKGLIGSSNTAGAGFSFGSRMPPNQPPGTFFISSNKPPGFTFGNVSHK